MRQSKRSGHNSDQIPMGQLTEDLVVKSFLADKPKRDIVSFPKNIIRKDKKNTLSTSIFIERRNGNQPEGAVSPHLVLFENLLTVVCKTYYKASFQSESWLKEIENCLPNQIDTQNGTQNNKKIKKTRKRDKRFGSKAQNLVGSAAQFSQRSPGCPTVLDETLGPDLISRHNVLDYLISPLKIDQVFGLLKRTMVCKGDRNI
jgi:hypothetical protein